MDAVFPGPIDGGVEHAGGAQRITLADSGLVLPASSISSLQPAVPRHPSPPIR